MNLIFSVLMLLYCIIFVLIYYSLLEWGVLDFDHAVKLTRIKDTIIFIFRLPCLKKVGHHHYQEPPLHCEDPLLRHQEPHPLNAHKPHPLLPRL